MGWTGINTRRSIAEVYQQEFRAQIHNGQIVRCVPCSVPGSCFDTGSADEQEYFLAWRMEDGNIIAVVILWKQMNDEVLYKIMDETAGPYSFNRCPQEIMDMLTPIEKILESGYAAQWRKRQSPKHATVTIS